MSPGRNAPCPCASGKKFKKCCEVRRPPKPAYVLGAEADPAYWRALRLARDPARLPGVTHEDPRTMALMLGVAGVAPPSRTAPRDEDFEALALALEAAAQSEPAEDDFEILLEAGRVVVQTPYDDELVAAIKRDVPGRRFDWRRRAWIAPRTPEVAAALRELVEAFWLEPAPDAEAWLYEADRWSAHVGLLDHAGAPAFVVWHRQGRPPAEVAGLAIDAFGDADVLLLAPAAARLLLSLEGADLDDLAVAAATACAEGGAPPPGARLVCARDEDAEPLLALEPGWSPPARLAASELSEVRTLARAGRFLFVEQSSSPAIPADPYLAHELRDLLADHPQIDVDPEAARLLERLEAEARRAQETVALSRATDAALTAAPRLAGELRPFQRAGVEYALRQRRTFLADEQGLGKTIQALAALEADGAFPAVVVCPSSLKLLWAAEAARWLPHRTVAVLGGRGAEVHPPADILVINYDVLDARADGLLEVRPRAVVLDESHYCKDARRKRTKAAQRLAAGVGQEGLCLALTGTPVLNRPRDLVSQLRTIGRLGEFGSGARMGRRFRGADAHERLHWHLRAHCYVRRLKRDVLPQLPAKRHATVPLSLDNAAEYARAERDVVAWLRTQPGDLRAVDARVAAALRAEQLVRLNALRRLAARGKLAAAMGWIEDFVDGGEPLVVFAHHRDVQQALVERFPGAGHVLGDDDARARQAAVETFQAADGPPLIVCSLEAASQGLTLTRASNVAFLELDWTPARLAQAEDRCHRIGQDRSVTAWYLLAPESIDDEMATLLAAKRRVIDAVTDGAVREDGAVLDAVVRSLRERDGGALALAA